VAARVIRGLSENRSRQLSPVSADPWFGPSGDLAVTGSTAFRKTHTGTGGLVDDGLLFSA
jgi:hypothetical protein